LYIWFAAALVPLAILLAWVLWPKGGAVGSLPSGASRYMVIETDKGRIVARLYSAEEADVPATVDNFAQKANSGVFNGRVFHRVEDWVIQGGDPNGDGSGGGEMPARYNQIPFKTGSLGVARGPDPSMNNDSQFFIVKIGAIAESLNGKYTNFGEVVEGMEVVHQIAIGDKMNSVTVVENP
jgi:peptidyl-prolyl cis-trans isomerase B (cyclophilin B)